MEACKDQNSQAQKELYVRFSPMMKGVCLRYASNEMEAEDLLQEAFIRAFKNMHQFENTGSLGAWLRKLTVHVALENYRKNKVIQMHLNKYSLSMEEENELDNALQNLQLEDLLKRIQHLPSGFRTIFNLYAVEGYNHAEIGKMLSISEGTSKSQYSRARAILRRGIEQEQEEEINKKMNYARG